MVKARTTITKESSGLRGAFAQHLVQHAGQTVYAHAGTDLVLAGEGVDINENMHSENAASHRHEEPHPCITEAALFLCS